MKIIIQMNYSSKQKNWQKRTAKNSLIDRPNFIAKEVWPINPMFFCKIGKELLIA
jgi:hypothetical protein